MPAKPPLLLWPADTSAAGGDSTDATDASAVAEAASVDGDPSEFGMIAARYALERERTRTVSRAYVDTPDLRLHAKGLGLVHDRVGRAAASTLRAVHGGGETEVRESGRSWPAFRESLPEQQPGVFAKAAGIRALLPACEVRVRVTPVRVLDDETKTVVRLDWEEPTVLRPSRVRLPSRVVVRRVRGYDKHAKRVIDLLREHGFAPGSEPDHVLALDAAGVLDARPATSVISGDQPAQVAVATALLGFLDAVEANVQGTVDDVDTEFLHDLRVAVRRTRSLLTLTGDVLPSGLARRYAPRFKWLGDLTTPNRDLDVYLLGYDAMAAQLVTAAADDLDPFHAHLVKSRNARRRSLVRGLRSARFATLVERWRADLEAVVSDGEGAEGPSATDLAGERIADAHRRVVKRARKITADSPSADVHDLRKRCKELRYLLEVFAPLHDRKASKRVIKDLKRVQDTLGAFQDSEVQRNALRTYADEMVAAGSGTGACLLAMGELTTIYDAKLRAARAELDGQLSRYLGGRTKRHLVELSGGAS